MCVFRDDRMECGTREPFGLASADISDVLGDLLADGDREKPLILDGLYLLLLLAGVPAVELGFEFGAGRLVERVLRQVRSLFGVRWQVVQFAVAAVVDV